MSKSHEIITEDLDGEDMSGWLVRDANVAEFEPQWRADRNAIDDRFCDDDMCVAEWVRNEDGTLGINFRFV